MPRSPEFEHDFLDHACRGAGDQIVGLTEMAKSRLKAGEEEYGDTSLGRPLEELVDEVEEEVVDVACWSALLAQADDFRNLDEDRRIGLLYLLDDITALAARQAFLVREVRQALAR